MIGTILSWLTGRFVNKITDLGKAYLHRQVSEAEFRAEVEKTAHETADKVQEAWAEAFAKMAESVQQSVRKSPVIARAYAIVLFLQLFVLVWYQLGAPAYQVITGTAWPDPAADIEWAYLLIGAMVGAGPLVFRR